VIILKKTSLKFSHLLAENFCQQYSKYQYWAKPWSDLIYPFVNFRPLSDSDVAQYSSKQSENFTTLNKPDLFEWASQVDLLARKNISISHIDREDLQAQGTNFSQH